MSFLNKHYDLLLFLNFFLSFFFILSVLPLLFRKIPPNKFYGFRVVKSLKSPENWYGINAYCAKHSLIWSLLQLLITLIATYFRDALSFSAIYLYILLFFPLIPVVLTFIHMSKNY